MFSVCLKDGTKKEFDKAITGLELASSLSKSLEKEAAAIRVNDQLWDLSRELPNEAKVEILTKSTAEGLEVLRHDAAHVLAQAVQELYPGTQVTIGPVIDNGFYYDFHKETPFTLEDLEKIEKRMKEIVLEDQPIKRSEMSRNDAIKFFKDKGEHFKVEIIESIPESETLSLYSQGSFTDLCRGPHLPSTKRLGTAFKLMKVAGAYWRGDHRNPMLQRIYGTAWATEDQLKNYLYMLEEAEKRDHRRLGQELELFHFQEEAPGSVFWHTKGWTLYRLIENYVRQELEKNDYIEVKTPQILDRSFWEASGHWEKFAENMFTIETEGKQFAVKPMNCPCHIQIFKQGLKSYRDLPIRMAEFGSCHRNEPSGALHGLNRVRAFVQDDAHIFCTPQQITSETKLFCDLLKKVYKVFGFEDIRIRFSDRPEKRAGSDHDWDQAEKALKEAAEAAGLQFDLNKGEGAFYGPKLEFVLRDAVGREWQCGTLQADYVLPERLNASYIDEEGKKQRPVMLHRAILGSFERFIGILIEHFAGKFPLWLAPTQVVIATITSEADAYAQSLADEMKAKGFRVELDLRNEKISYKVREHSHKKVPQIWAVGRKEEETKQVSVRRLGSPDQTVITYKEAVSALLQEIESKK